MNDLFDLPVILKGKELMFQSQLLQYGYIHKFKVDVNGREVMFEPDEERNYRAMVDPSIANNIRESEMELLKIIAQALQDL